MGQSGIASRNLLKVVALGAALSTGVPSGTAGEPVWKAFRSPHKVQGPTLFEEMAPAHTRISDINQYNDPSMWADRYQEFLFGAVGTGLAIGDYDLDGLPDLFVVNKCGPSRLYKNQGNWVFADVTESSGLSTAADPSQWKQGAAFADLNNDGYLDLYLCRFGAPNLFFKNDGNGHFTECAKEFGLDIVDGSGMAYFCDYDRDGWLDLYLATNILDSKHHPAGQVGRLLHSERGTRFTDVTGSAVAFVESQCHSAAWWDYDNDGWPDLYVANDYGVPDHLYRNLGDGHFADVMDRVIPRTSYSSMGCDAADVNNDGRLDLFVADMAARTHEKDQRSIADSRARFSKDGLVDDRITPKYHRNALLVNTGMDRFQEAGFLAGVDATDWTWSVLFGDFDCDGLIDLFTTNGMLVEQNVDLNNRMMSAESAMERIRIMHASPPLLERNLAFRNGGDLRFMEVSAAWGIDQNGISFGAAWGDLDDDGNLDLVVSNYQKAPSVYRNCAPATHRLKVRLKGTVSNSWGVGARVEIETANGNQVRELSLGRGYLSTSEPVIHFGLGGSEIVQRLTVRWPSGIVQVFEDVPADGTLAIDEQGTPNRDQPEPSHGFTRFSRASDTFAPRTADKPDVIDEFAVQPLLPRRFDRRGPALSIGNFGGTGGDSIVVGGSATSPAQAYFRTSAQPLTPVSLPRFPGAGPSEDGPLVTADFNGDGKMDLLISKGGNRLPAEDEGYQPILFWNSGTGLAAALKDALPNYHTSAGALAVSDFNRDGVLDVFVGGRLAHGNYPHSPRSALWAGGNGQWRDVTTLVCPALSDVGMVTSALWSDVDKDGWLDLLVTLDWGSVRYFHNQNGSTLEDWSDRAGFTQAGSGWWSSIDCGDFNEDGRLDYLVGNVGANTQYKASPGSPAVIYAGDPDENGSAAIIEAYFENGILFPWRTRKDLSLVFPWISKRYPRNDIFSKSSLLQIFGDSRLASCRKFEATQLLSGLFLSRPDGRFVFHELPHIAQIAPIVSLTVADFDGDGHDDVYALQNDFSPAPCIGSFDGGVSQLLRGDGSGALVPSEPFESGLVVPGPGAASAAVDLNGDGWPDLLVSQTDGKVFAFENRGHHGAGSLCIEFETTAGGEVVPGAFLEFRFKGGRTKIVEMHANAGGSFNSPLHCFVGFQETSPPESLVISWPSGRTSSHDLRTAAKRLLIQTPRR